MGKLDILIREKCPNGVEYKTVGGICTIEKGTQLNKDSLLDDGKYPVINGDISPSGCWNEYNFDGNKITISQGGASAGYVNYIKTPFWAGAHCYVVKECDRCIVYDYLWHFLRNKQPDMMSKQIGAGIPSVSLKMINDFRIPVPPIEIQQEIVRMLNSFTELEAELEAELIKRKQQYEHYRDHLLSFENIAGEGGQVEWLTLGNIGEVCMCKRILKNQTQDSGIPFFKIGTFGKKEDAYITPELFEEYKRKYSYPKKGDILISAAGTIGRTVIFDGEPAYFQDSNIVWIDNDEEKVTNRYLYYFYQTKPWRVSSGGTIARIYNNDIKSVKIPVPTKNIQERIVYVLDNFDAVCNDLNIGLPAEIEARQKQYEYYRDRLLSFDAVVGDDIERERERED